MIIWWLYDDYMNYDDHWGILGDYQKIMTNKYDNFPAKCGCHLSFPASALILAHAQVALARAWCKGKNRGKKGGTIMGF